MNQDRLEIPTPRLLLATASTKHAGRLLQYAVDNRDHLAAWEPRRAESYFAESFWSVEMERAEEEHAAGSSLRLILLDAANPEGPALGLCNFRNIVRGAFQACHLGYSLDHRHQGRGLMFEALDAAIVYVFDSLCLHRVMANYIPANERSARLLSRLGFEREGLARDYLFIDGRWQDHVLTSRINPQWVPEGSVET